jgi:hypothetical protein
MAVAMPTSSILVLLWCMMLDSCVRLCVPSLERLLEVRADGGGDANIEYLGAALVHDARQLVNAELRTVAEAESYPAEVVLLGQRRAKTLRNQCDSGCCLMLFLFRDQRADGRDDWHGSGDRGGGSGRGDRESSRDDRGSNQRLIEARLEKCEVEVVLKLGNASRELLDTSVLHRHSVVDDG